MNGHDDLPRIHQSIADVLAGLGFTDHPCQQTGILIRNGFCCGRQFYYEGVRVLWLVDDAALEVYDDSGRCLKRVALAERHIDQKHAA